MAASSGRAPGAASVPVIKLELDDDSDDVDTADGGGAERQQNEATSSTDNLMELTTEQSDALSFPEGCPVVYNFRTDNGVLEMREGVVRAVSLNTDKRRFEYRIERRGTPGGEEPALETAIEDEIAYAMNCPISVRPGENSGEDDRVEGKILYSKPVDENGTRSMSYIVQYSGDGNNGILRMEEGVAAGRISFNKNAAVEGGINNEARNDGVRDGGLEGNGIRPGGLQQQDGQPAPVVVPDISPNCSQDEPPLESSLGRKGEASGKGVSRKDVPASKEPDVAEKRGEATQDERKNDGPRTTKKKPTPSIKSNSLMQADDDGETSDLSDSCVGFIPNNHPGAASSNRPAPASAAALTRQHSRDSGGMVWNSRPAATNVKRCSRTAAGGSGEVDSSPDHPAAAAPVQHRKINFQPPNPLRRQNSAASGGDCSKKRGADALAAIDYHESRMKKGMAESSSEFFLAKTASAAATSPSLAKSSNHGDGFLCELTVPLWVNYGVVDLFTHIVKLGYKKRIYDRTGCDVHLSRCKPDKGVPMVISIKTEAQYGQACRREDVERAIEMAEESLLDFHGQKDAHERLRFEMRAGSTGSVLPRRSGGGALEACEGRWQMLLELSRVRSCDVRTARGGRKYLSDEMYKSLLDATGCTAKVYGGDRDSPLTLCEPYVLVEGKDPEQVERAAAMVTDGNRAVQGQDQLNGDRKDATEVGSPDPVQHRKINFEPPNHLKRQNSAASGEDTGKRNRASSSTAATEDQYERLTKLAKTSQTVGSSKAKKPSGDLLTCTMTVPLWMKYGRDDLFHHIIGKQGNGVCGHRTKKNREDTGCCVKISPGNPEEGVPMVISVKEDKKSDHCNMGRALHFVENSLFNFHKKTGINGRLKFELRAGATGNYLQNKSEGGAVLIKHNCWAQLVELSSVRNGGVVVGANGRKQLCDSLQKSIWDVTRCTAEFHVGHPRRPLELCKPYILVTGSESDQVETAAAMIMNAQQNAQAEHLVNFEGEEGEINSPGSEVWAL